MSATTLPSTSNGVTKWDMELATAKYMPMYRAAQRGDWKELGARLRNGDINPDTIISMYSENIIHVMASSGRKSTALLRTVLNDSRFDTRILSARDRGGNTALFFASMVGNTDAAKILVEKAPEVLTLPDSDGTFPVYVAARLGHRKTTGYLIGEMKTRSDHNFRDEKWGVLLLNLLITAAFYDMALDLLRDFPELGYGHDMNGTSPLQTLSNRALGGNRSDALELIRQICEAVSLNAPKLNKTPTDFLWAPLLKAVELGTYEIVTEIVDACPYIVWFTDDNERTIYHHAVIHRHERIFNLIWDLGPNRHRITDFSSSEDGTNILHLAGLLGTTTASRVSGAAMQMQRELQWFKEVEKLAQVSFQEARNLNQKTPRMVFTEEHKDLLKAAEEWMKTTASAYTLVAALIVTILFAAAFTLPGGNDSNGIPNFVRKPSFIVFSIANSIGFISSSTSLMVLLGILTSRYSEIDFLHSLPRKLVIGLSTLFLSILCMLVAFSAALYLYLVYLSKYVMIPIIVCPSIPAILFLFLQFPLLYEVTRSTFGRSIFRQEPKSIKTSPTYVGDLASASASSSDPTSLQADV